VTIRLFCLLVIEGAHILRY